MSLNDPATPKQLHLMWGVSGFLVGMLFVLILLPPNRLPETPQVHTTDYTTVYAQVQEWQVEMAEIAPRLEKMHYHLQAIHKRVLLPTLDIDMTK